MYGNVCKCIKCNTDGPKFYKGKNVNGQKIQPSGETIILEEIKFEGLTSPEEWEKCVDEFTKWGSAEFFEGRPWPPLRKSSCKQVMGSVGRLVMSSRKLTSSENVVKGWQKILNVSTVKSYVDELTTLGRCPSYIVSEVLLLYFSI